MYHNRQYCHLDRESLSVCRYSFNSNRYHYHSDVRGCCYTDPDAGPDAGPSGDAGTDRRGHPGARRRRPGRYPGYRRRHHLPRRHRPRRHLPRHHLPRHHPAAHQSSGASAGRHRSNGRRRPDADAIPDTATAAAAAATAAAIPDTIPDTNANSIARARGAAFYLSSAAATRRGFSRRSRVRERG